MNEPVLVLNANFAPINVCVTRRAVGMIVTGKAAMVINGRGYIRTVGNSFRRPSVIRLEYMVSVPRPRVKFHRKEIFRRDNYTCQYCGTNSETLTLDHVLPRRMGGEHKWENLVSACARCNHIKGGRTVQQARMYPNRKPFEPKSTANYTFGKYLSIYEEWKDFIRGW